MLYELIAVVRSGRINEVKEIARTTGSLVLNSGGVVRGITNWGTYLLTKPVRKHQAKHSEGHHFLMRFDCSPTTQESVRKMLSLDPRMIKFGVVKVGEKLDDIKDVEGRVWWNSEEERQTKGWIRETENRRL
ncbi:28S ribosomal protein S6, mitochondrial [Agyrium rufum]|nr:28S ribosomal protein S6, mitochondrial [Agyrium rufum]